MTSEVGIGHLRPHSARPMPPIWIANALSTMSIFGALVLAGSNPGSAADRVETIAVCWSNGKQIECTADTDADKATKYCRSQCRFWASTPSEKAACHEVWRCSETGFAGVVYRTGGSDLTGFCGLSSESETRAKMSSACGTRCEKHIWKLGSLETAFKEIERKTIEAAVAQATRNVSQSVRALIVAKLLDRNLLPFPPALVKYVYSLDSLRSRIDRLELQLDVTKGARTELAIEIEKLTSDTAQADRDLVALEHANPQLGQAIQNAKRRTVNAKGSLSKEEKDWFEELLRMVRAASAN